MPDKHFDPSQNLTGKRYLQICFDRTYGRIRRAFLQLKTYQKTYAQPYFWLEVTGLGKSRYRDTSACARRAPRSYNGRTVSRHLKRDPLYIGWSWYIISIICRLVSKRSRKTLCALISRQQHAKKQCSDPIQRYHISHSVQCGISLVELTYGVHWHWHVNYY